MYKIFKNLIPYIIFQNKNLENILIISKKNLIFSLNFLKHHFNYKYTLLSCISGVDFLNCKYRFNIVYELLSLKYNSRLRLKIFITEIDSVPSISSLFINANWWEREIWDLFGIYFENHPDLRRILTDYGFEGYPLRKDFPLYGYLEVRYDSNKKRIILEPLELSQEFRNFNFQTPW